MCALTPFPPLILNFMKKLNSSRLRLLTWAVLFAAGGFASCSDNGGDEPAPAPPVELKNQIEYDGGKLIDIKSVIFDVEDTDLYTFYLSPTAGITDIAGMSAAKDYLAVVVRNPKGQATRRPKPSKSPTRTFR